MKAIVLPLALCAALAGCADYGTVAYGTSPGYYPYAAAPYGTYPYGAYPAYGTTYPEAGYLYGAPAVNLSIYGGGGRGWHGRDRDREHHRHDARAMGNGPAHSHHRDRAGGMLRPRRDQH